MQFSILIRSHAFISLFRQLQAFHFHEGYWLYVSDLYAISPDCQKFLSRKRHRDLSEVGRTTSDRRVLSSNSTVLFLLDNASDFKT